MQKGKTALFVLASMVLASAVFGCKTTKDPSSSSLESSTPTSVTSPSDTSVTTSDVTTSDTTSVTTTSDTTSVDTTTSETTSSATSVTHTFGPWEITVEPTLTTTGIAVRSWTDDPSHTEDVQLPVLSNTDVWTKSTGKAVTCEADGEDVYTSTYGTVKVTIPSTGHDYGDPVYEWNSDNTEVTATRVCANDRTHVETEKVSVTHETTTQPTCDNDGVETYTTAAFKNSAFTVQTKTLAIDALGHAYEDPTYEWNLDNTEVTATRVCVNDPLHTQTETVAATHETTTQPTCEDDGVETYTSAAFENPEFEVQVKTVPINAKGHAYGEAKYEWNADNTEVTATKVCANDPKHIITETVTVTSKVTKEATCSVAGEKTYTATFGNPEFETQVKKEEIPMVEHIFDGYELDIEPTFNETGTAFTSCTVCGELGEEVEVPALNDTTVWEKTAASVEPTADSDGSYVFTSVYGEVTITIPKLSDSDVWACEHRVVPTCDVAGLDVYTSVYGTVEVPLNQLGHDYGEWTIVTHPSMDETGSATRECANDPTHPEIVVLPVLSDTSVWTIVEEETVAPTEYAGGLTTYNSIYGKVRVAQDALGGKWELSDSGLAFGAETTVIRTNGAGTTEERNVTLPQGVFTDNVTNYGETDVYSLTYSGTYYFEANNGTFTSNNQGVDSSTATMKFTPKVDVILTYTVNCSGESGYDYYFDSLHSSTKIGDSTNAGVTKTITVELSAGSSFTFNYKKDGSGDKGRDEAIVSNITVTYSSTAEAVKSSFAVIPFVDGNNLIDVKVALVGGSLEMPAAPEKAGCIFDGWFDSLLLTQYTDSSTFKEYTVLHAKYSEAYTVTVHADNDTEVTTVLARIGEEAVLENPTKPGFRFAGWYTDAEFTSALDLSANTSTDYDIYAKWEEAPAYTGTYKVYNVYSTNSFNSQSDIVIDEEGNISGLKTGIITGYDPVTGIVTGTIGGTNCAMFYKDGVFALPFSAKDTFGNDLLFGVKATSVTSKVQYGINSNNTKFINVVTPEKTYNVLFDNETFYTDVTFTKADGTDVNLADKEKMGTIIVKDSSGNILLAKGYSSSWVDLDDIYGTYTLEDGTITATFDGIGGFRTDDPLYPNPGKYVIHDGYVSVTMNKGGKLGYYFEYVLNKEAKTFTVTMPEVTISFVTDGHEAVAPISVNKNVPLTLANAPVDEKSVFNGWYFDPEFTEAVPEGYIPTENKTVYAKYSVAVYVTVNNNDGNDPLHVKYSMGDTTAITDPSYAGHMFCGYYTTETYDVGSEWTNGVINSNVTIYAKWIDAPFYVSGTSYNYGYSIGKSSSRDQGEIYFDRTLNMSLMDNYTGSGNAYPFYGSISYSFDPTDLSRLTITKGSTSYDAYVSVKENIWVLVYSDTSIVVFSRNGETSNLSTSKFSASYFNKGKTMLIEYTDPSDTVHNIFVDNGVVYFGAIFADGFGNAIATADVKKAYSLPSLAVTINGETRYYVSSDSGLVLGEKDGLEGTYANGNDNIVIDGLGVVKIGDKVGSYTANGNTLSAYTADGYYEITLDVTAKTYTMVQPTVTVTYNVPEQGTIPATSVTVNKNVALALPEVTIVDPLYEFKGWFLDSEFTEAVPEGYAPAADATLYAKVTAVPVGLSKGNAVVVTLADVDGKNGKEATFTSCETTSDHLDYFFKLDVSADDTYYFKFNNKVRVGNTGSNTSTNYMRYVITKDGEANSVGTYSCEDQYNNGKITLTAGTYYVRVNLAEAYTSGEGKVWGKFDMSVATSNLDSVANAATLAVGTPVTTSFIDKTTGYIKFDVEAGKTYNLTGSKNPTIYLGNPTDSSTAQSSTRIYWAQSTITLEVTESSTYYIETMYDGVTFTLEEVVAA